jgi:hypothetical protein
MRLRSGPRLRVVEVAFEGRVEKVMSLTLAEFQNSLVPLSGRRLEAGDVMAVVGVGAGRAVIEYEARPAVRFGGLLDLPRALVSITFDDVAPDDQTAFIKRFDFAFQRGGG